jgi:hypothetical protein
MVLTVQILDVLLTLVAAVVVARSFRHADQVPGADEDWCRHESERGLAQIEAYLEHHRYHRGAGHGQP